MEDDGGVKNLLELIFVKTFKITAEMTRPDSSFPICLLINDFPQKLHHVLLAKRIVISLKWSNVFDSYIYNKLLTHQEYLKCIIFACFNEYYCHQNIFDSFICVCSFVTYFSFEIFNKKGVNFKYLNFYIIMEFFQSVMKKSFLKCGGLNRLVEYIHHHEHLSWNLDKNFLGFLADPSTPRDVDFAKKFEKEILKEGNIRKSIKVETPIIEESANSLAQKVLSIASVELSILPSGNHDSNRTVDASKLNDKVKTGGGKRPTKADLKFDPLKKVIQGYSNSDSKDNLVAEQKEEIARCESIVQAVIKYNHSKASGLANWDNHIQKKGDEILKHLKDTIESLIDVLDEYDKE